MLPVFAFYLVSFCILNNVKYNTNLPIVDTTAHSRTSAFWAQLTDQSWKSIEAAFAIECWCFETFWLGRFLEYFPIFNTPNFSWVRITYHRQWMPTNCRRCLRPIRQVTWAVVREAPSRSAIPQCCWDLIGQRSAITKPPVPIMMPNLTFVAKRASCRPEPHFHPHLSHRSVIASIRTHRTPIDRQIFLPFQCHTRDSGI